MPRSRPPHLYPEVRKAGVYWYVRKGNGPRTPLRAPYGTEAFWEEYRAALAAPKARPEKDTLAWLIERFRAEVFPTLKLSTRRQYDTALNRVIEKSGSLAIAKLTPEIVAQTMRANRDKPGSANNFLKSLRAVFKWAIDAQLVKKDPTADVGRIKYKKKPHATWAPEDMQKFRDFWPIGTKERLAFELFYHTGLRVSDVYRIGRQHIRAGQIAIQTTKTGTPVFIPVSEELAAICAATPTSGLSLLGYGSAGALANWFRKARAKAGVSHTPPHGIRKAAAIDAAHAGATEAEMNAAFGWVSPDMAAHYIRDADRERLGAAAFSKRQKRTKS